MEYSLNPNCFKATGSEDENYWRSINGSRDMESHHPFHGSAVLTTAIASMWQQQSSQRHPADPCSADSRSRIDTPESMDDRQRARKRAGKEIVKGDLETLGEIGQLKSGKGYLRVQLDEVKKKNQELHERIRQISDDLEKEKAEHKEVKDKYIALLEKSNQFVNPKRFETRSSNTAQQPGPASICGSVTGNPANAI